MNVDVFRRTRLLRLLTGVLLLAAVAALAACGIDSGSTAGSQPAGPAEESVAGGPADYAASPQGWTGDWYTRKRLQRLVVVGDSLGATQNSCLLETQTVNLYPSLIAAQAGVEMPVPLIEFPGFPGCLKLEADGSVGQYPGYGWRRPETIGMPVYNLSVPGTRVQGALDPLADVAFFSDPVLFPQPYPYDLLHLQVLGLSTYPPDPGRSMVQWAIDLDPTTLIVWLGANDVLWSAIFADPGYITGYDEATGTVDVSVFARQYFRLLATLRRHTHAPMVVANIPDVTVIPYLMPAGQMLARVAADPTVPLTVEQLFYVLSLTPDDYLTLQAPNAIPAAIAAFLATGQPQTLPGRVVFTPEEVAIASDAVERFNAVIAITAWLMGAPVVDVHALLDEVDAEGYAVGGRVITTDFLGGVFTLDGIHPTNTGHAVMANEFIQVMNRRLHTRIPLVDVEAVFLEDPLIFPPPGPLAAAGRAAALP